jgi:hypothetical protein
MFDLKLVHLAAYNSSIVQSYGNVSVKVNKFTRSLCVSSLVIVLLFPKQKAKPKTSLRNPIIFQVLASSSSYYKK